MRESISGVCILFLLLASAKSTQSNSTLTQTDGPDSRVEHLKKYCGVKNWTKKMPDWLMFRTGYCLRWSISNKFRLLLPIDY